MVFLNSFNNPLNQKRISIITFQNYDFLKNHYFPGYAGGLVKLPHPYPGNFSFSHKSNYQFLMKILQQRKKQL